MFSFCSWWIPGFPGIRTHPWWLRWHSDKVFSATPCIWFLIYDLHVYISVYTWLYISHIIPQWIVFTTPCFHFQVEFWTQLTRMITNDWMGSIWTLSGSSVNRLIQTVPRTELFRFGVQQRHDCWHVAVPNWDHSPGEVTPRKNWRKKKNSLDLP